MVKKIFKNMTDTAVCFFVGFLVFVFGVSCANNRSYINDNTFEINTLMKHFFTAHCLISVLIQQPNISLPWSSFSSFSVLMVERPPILLKITESLPRKSAVSPVYNSPPV